MEKWSSLKFGELNVESNDTEHTFDVHVYLDGLDPGFVQVQLYADATSAHAVVIQRMTQIESDGENNSPWVVYRATVAATRPTTDFTPRIVPDHSAVEIPLELNLIRWQR